MADIFISYSSKDREKAVQLTDLLISAGLSVWIDQSGIEVATSWSGEIVDAIDNCNALIVLLSPNSVQSKNVVREVSLAFEKNKKILPLDLEPVVLSRDLQYHLAGIQRASMENTDAVLRALGKLGFGAIPTTAPAVVSVISERQSVNNKKTLMILPFEDLSPTADNGWFTDGMASELTSSLSNIKSLRLIDWNTSSMFKNRKVRTVDLAREFEVRYFIEGQVRKFGDQIKISVTLLDIQSGDHLWQDSLKGTMEDIFEIQETVAKKVTEGLNIVLTNSEKKELDKKPTENIEAYELWLQGRAYNDRHRIEDYHLALSLFKEATRLDPKFVDALSGVVAVCQNIYRSYDRNPQWLQQAEQATEAIKQIEGRSSKYLWAESSNALLRADPKAALEFAKEAVETDPSFFLGFDALGYAHKALGNIEEMVQAWQEQSRLRDTDIVSRFTLLVALNELGDADRLRAAAIESIPLFERHIRLNPDDYFSQVQFATMLPFADREDKAIELADQLSTVKTLDPVAIYNLACIYLHCNENKKGFATLQLALEKGFKAIETLRRDPDLNVLREWPEFKVLLTTLEEKIKQETEG